MTTTNREHHRTSAHLHRRAGVFHATSAAASVAAILGIIQGNSEQRAAAAWRRIAIASAVVGLGATITAYAIGRAARELSMKESAVDQAQVDETVESSNWAGNVRFAPRAGNGMQR